MEFSVHINEFLLGWICAAALLVPTTAGLFSEDSDGHAFGFGWFIVGGFITVLLVGASYGL